MRIGSSRSAAAGMDAASLERDCTHRSESARDGDSGHGAAGLPQSVPEHCVYMEFRKELGDGLFSEERWVNWRRRMERVVEGKGEKRGLWWTGELCQDWEAASQRLPGRALNPVGSSGPAPPTPPLVCPRIPCRTLLFVGVFT